GLACKLEATPSSIWMFDVQRGRRQAAFDDNDAKLLRHLVPHFSPGSTDQPGSGIDDDGCFVSHLSFGIVLVDSQMRIVASNEVANAILDRRSSQIRNKNGAL
ncbi:MAG: LuxR family transcriptional regulator, partial [Phyllobacterium sp.]